MRKKLVVCAIILHFFKIRKGKIYDIEAAGLVLPYGTKTGWE